MTNIHRDEMVAIAAVFGKGDDKIDYTALSKDFGLHKDRFDYYHKQNKRYADIQRMRSVFNDSNYGLVRLIKKKDLKIRSRTGSVEKVPQSISQRSES